MQCVRCSGAVPPKSQNGLRNVSVSIWQCLQHPSAYFFTILLEVVEPLCMRVIRTPSQSLSCLLSRSYKNNIWNSQSVPLCDQVCKAQLTSQLTLSNNIKVQPMRFTLIFFPRLKRKAHQLRALHIVGQGKQFGAGMCGMNDCQVRSQIPQKTKTMLEATAKQTPPPPHIFSTRSDGH